MKKTVFIVFNYLKDSAFNSLVGRSDRLTEKSQCSTPLKENTWILLIYYLFINGFYTCIQFIQFLYIDFTLPLGDEPRQNMALSTQEHILGRPTIFTRIWPCSLAIRLGANRVGLPMFSFSHPHFLYQHDTVFDICPTLEHLHEHSHSKESIFLFFRKHMASMIQWWRYGGSTVECSLPVPTAGELFLTVARCTMKRIGNSCSLICDLHKWIDVGISEDICLMLRLHVLNQAQLGFESSMADSA